MQLENVDRKTVEGCGDEWSRFDQEDVTPEEARAGFESYFRVFPWHDLSRSGHRDLEGKVDESV